MSDGFPNMKALLALVAIAGFQNRDKIAEMLKGVTGGSVPAPANTQAAPAGRSTPASLPSPGSVLGGIGAGGVGGLLTGGISEMLKKFQDAGHGPTAQSWINTGPNAPVSTDALHSTLGPDVLADLSKKTGLDPAEILKRLSKDLPSSVDQYTPDGRVPA